MSNTFICSEGTINEMINQYLYLEITFMFVNESFKLFLFMKQNKRCKAHYKNFSYRCDKFERVTKILSVMCTY